VRGGREGALDGARVPTWIQLCGVEEVDAELNGAIHDLPRLLLGVLLPESLRALGGARGGVDGWGWKEGATGAAGGIRAVHPGQSIAILSCPGPQRAPWSRGSTATLPSRTPRAWSRSSLLSSQKPWRNAVCRRYYSDLSPSTPRSRTSTRGNGPLGDPGPSSRCRAVARVWSDKLVRPTTGVPLSLPGGDLFHLDGRRIT